MVRILFIFLVYWNAILHPSILLAIEEAKIDKPLKLLHLSFHKGCIKEFDAVAKLMDLDVETWFVPDLPHKWFDGTSKGNALYNIGHDRAERIWSLHKKTFETFDVILTSDTAPLARIFLQNDFKKPLIIWVCNRFDYYDNESLDCEFPDPEYYQLIDKAYLRNNVYIASYTAFEQYYANRKNVDLGSMIITPTGLGVSNQSEFISSIPVDIIKEESFFLPPYHNETQFTNMAHVCDVFGIKAYCGRYGGPHDLKDFKGIIHLPYAWSNLALFENMALGITYFLPSTTLLKKFYSEKDEFNLDSAVQDAKAMQDLASSTAEFRFNLNPYFFTGLETLITENLFEISEWYNPERRDLFIYFDSWEDL